MINHHSGCQIHSAHKFLPEKTQKKKVKQRDFAKKKIKYNAEVRVLR